MPHTRRLTDGAVRITWTKLTTPVFTRRPVAFVVVEFLNAPRHRSAQVVHVEIASDVLYIRPRAPARPARPATPHPVTPFPRALAIASSRHHHAPPPVGAAELGERAGGRAQQGKMGPGSGEAG